MVTFEMVGKLAPIKETEKFKPYEVKEYASGWVATTFKYNVVSDTSRFMMQTKGMHTKSEDNVINVMSKSYKDDKGNVVKGESFSIPYKDRFNKEKLDLVAGWRKFTLDLADEKERKLRYEMEDELKSDKPNLEKFDVSSKEELQTKYNESCKMKKEFVAQDDYAELLKKMLDSEQYKDAKFYISGSIEYNYSDKNNKWYQSYVPNKILLTTEGEDMAEAQAKIYFDSNALMDDDEKALVNAYISEYDNKAKRNKFVPYPIVIKKDDGDVLSDKAFDIRKSRFIVEDESVYELGVKLTLIDGAETKKMNVEDLPEEVQDAILIGDITEKEALREFGGVAYGDRVTESRFKGLGRGYAKGREETSYSPEDLLNTVTEEVEDEDDDLFG